MKTFLKITACFILVLIVIVVVMLYLNKTEKSSVPHIIKNRIEQYFEKKPVVVDNKIEKKTPNQVLQNAIDLLNYKHTKFLKNIDKSVTYAVDNNHFILAENISNYKKLYLELYDMKVKLEKENKTGQPVDFNKNEDFLLKCIELDNVNKIISKLN